MVNRSLSWFIIYFSWGFRLYWMLSWILGYLSIDWFWKSLVWCVYVYVHSLTCVFICVSVPVCHMVDKFCRTYRTYTCHHNPTYTRFLNWDYWKDSLKRSLKNRWFSTNWKLTPIALVLKRRTLSISKAIDKVTLERSNHTYWKILPYFSADMAILGFKR